jgi:hypothetical protein
MGKISRVSKQFLNDLQRGKVHENVVLTYIKGKYPDSYIKEGKFKDYDIWIPEIEMGVEVKSDEMSKYTKNILIEIEFAGKPSALSTTKADFWVIWDGDEYNWFKVEDIHRCIKENRLKPKKFTSNGDKSPKKAYLIKKDVLYKYRSSVSSVA